MIKCHLCNGVLFPRPILQLNKMPKAAQYYPEKREFHADKGIAINIRQCSDCGLVQLDAKPVWYFKEVITAASLSEKARLSRLSQMQELVNKFRLQGKKVLDVGSCKGEMLNVLKDAGFKKAIGLEASLDSVIIGRSARRTMIHGYIGNTKNIKGAPFDAFISLNYLEHLPYPGKIIQAIHRNITLGAIGFVTVPNFDYLKKTKCFYEFVADHLSYFTKDTLRFAFEKNGFEILDCYIINNDNDIAIIVKKRVPLDISDQYIEVEDLIKNLQHTISEYTSKEKKVAVWGAGHRTLALLALSKARDIEYIIDSAKFKHGKFSPIMHTKIVPPDYLKENKVDLVIVMVPGIYPEEVCKTLFAMKLGADIAILKDNKIKFIKENNYGKN